MEKAIVRPPASTFVEGLTSSRLGRADPVRALQQHQAYCQALRDAGLEVLTLEPDAAFPDSTYVEDAAVVVNDCGILTRPGAESRRGEVAGIGEALRAHVVRMAMIEPPGTLDGGDVCPTDDGFLIGISRRTNEDGARQLARLIEREGYPSTFVDIRQIPGLLHLKTALSAIGEGRLVVAPALARRSELARFEALRVDEDEAYAANCIRVNDRVVIAAGFPKFAASLARLGYRAVPVEVSEFRKTDGGVSCLSVRL